MIKAEVITHETYAAPNWLDHCRSIVTPSRVSITLLVLLLVIAGGSLLKHKPSAPASLSPDTGFTSTPATNAKPLLVIYSQTGLASQSAAGSNEQIISPSLQPANSAGDAAVSGNMAGTSNSGTTLPTTKQAVGPAPTSSQNSLQNAVTNNPVTQTVQTTVNNLLSAPNLLGH